MKKANINKVISLIKKAKYQYDAFYTLTADGVMYVCLKTVLLKFDAAPAEILQAFKDCAAKLNVDVDYFIKDNAVKLFNDLFKDRSPIYFDIVGETAKSADFPALIVIEKDDTKLFFDKRLFDIIPADGVIFQDEKAKDKSPILFNAAGIAGLILPININPKNPETAGKLYKEAQNNKLNGGKKSMKKEAIKAPEAAAGIALENKTETAKTETAAGVKVVFKDGTIKYFPADIAALLANDPTIDYIGEKDPETAATPAPEAAAAPETTTEATTEAATTPAADAAAGLENTFTIDDITPDNYTGFLFSIFGGGRDNNNIIMLSGFNSGVYGYKELIEYLNDGKRPDYHTFEVWKSRGYIVKKGEKASFTADIWKYTEKKGSLTAEEAAKLNSMIENADGSTYAAGDETTTSRYIMKKSFFFGPSQVEKIEKKPFTAPEGCTLKTEGNKEILTGNTKPHKEAIKSAGFFWNKSGGYWYRIAS